MSCVINPTYFSMFILCFSQRYYVGEGCKKTIPATNIAGVKYRRKFTELFYKSKMFFILPSIILFSSNIGLNLDIEIPEDE